VFSRLRRWFGTRVAHWHIPAEVAGEHEREVVISSDAATMRSDRAVTAKLLSLIVALLSFVLLGVGYYLVTMPAGVMVAGIRQNVWFGVGQSVIASAIVTLVMLLASRADRIASEQLTELVVRSLDESGRSLADYRSAVEVMKQTGMRRIHNDRYIRPVYQHYQAKVSNQLDLIGMSLKHFQQDVGEELLKWVTDRDKLHIRIMVLNPRSSYCRVRDAEEGGTTGEIAEWAMRLTEAVLRANHSRIQIRWYNTLPTVNMYRLDDVIFLGSYLIGRLSRLTVTLEVDVAGLLAEQYLAHFDNLWNPPAEHADWSMTPTIQDVQAARKAHKR